MNTPLHPLPALRRLAILGLLAPLAVLTPGHAQSTSPAATDDEVISLEAFEVSSFREGRSLALQQQRDSTNLRNIVSADAVGQLPDQNIADAVSRLPGVSLLGDAGEGRFVSIRGLNPNLNNVTLNGTAVASSGRRDIEGRDSVSGSSMPLDVIGSAQVASIEVIKAATPDMDANAIGGTINLKTVSAFNFKERTLYGSLAGGYSDLAGRYLQEGDITFANRFGADQRGALALSANYSKRPFQLEAFQSVWQTTPFGGNELLPQSLELLPELAERRRLGFTGNVELRSPADHEYYVRINFNRFDEDLERQESVFRTTNRQGAFVGDRVLVYNVMRADVDGYIRTIERTQASVTAGAVHRLGEFTLETEVTYSDARYNNDNQQSFRFRNPNANTSGFRIDYSDFLLKIDTGSNGLTNLANYGFERWDDGFFRVRGNIWTPKLDIIWQPDDAPLGDAFTLKTGLKFNREERDQFTRRTRYSGGSIRLNEISGGVVIPGLPVRGVPAPFDIQANAVLDYFRANLNRLNLDRVATNSLSARDTFAVDEDILAAYAMVTTRFDRLTMLGGFRFERTSATVRGEEHRRQGNQPGPIVINTDNYDFDHFLPNLQARFEITPTLLLRAAWTHTIARPEYEYATPTSVLTYNPLAAPDDPAFPLTGSITIGNPDLQPYEASNFDIGLEYYLPNRSVFSIGAFHKRVDNPIYPINTVQERVVREGGLAFERLTTSSFGNANRATVKGVEFSAFLPFTFLPGPFDGLGVEANLALMSSSVSVPGRAVDLPLFEQPDRTFNAALFYEKDRFATRLAYTYQSSSLRELSNGPDVDFYRAKIGQLDAQASYRLTSGLTLFVNAQNLNNASQDTYSGSPERLRYSRLTGTYYRAGVRFRF